MPQDLAPGAHLGPYEIREFIGRGGMGEVYRARDIELQRDVALKILPPAFAEDSDRIARFEREAHTLASLNHPHIAQIYGVASNGAQRGLAMEFVAGETLAERLDRGPLPLPEALDIARQLADALDAAHEQGVVHRDLKPANVKVTPDGTVKLLDFGIAKLQRPESGHGDVTNAPTLMTGNTESGMMLGTAAYMSPEQATGRRVDKRTDIWAFGAVLYEMLAGRRLFEGENVTELIASVLHGEPDWSRLPRATPPHVRHLLARCLTRDIKRRLRDIADLRHELDDGGGRTFAVPPSGRGTSRTILAAGLLFMLGASLGVFATWRFAGRPTRIADDQMSGQFSITLASDQPLASLDQPAFVLSPDGKRLALIAGTGTPQLYPRDLADTHAHVVPGTEGAFAPFFSPDGRSVAFFANGQLKRVAVDGGDPVTICGDVRNPRGGAWNADGTIAVTPAPGSALFRVSADGGTLRPFTKLDVARGEGAHHWPEFMPDGKAVLYVAATGKATAWDERDIVVESLVSGERHVVGHGSSVRYVTSGHLVIARGGALTAVPFDANRLQTTGAPIRLTDGVMLSPYGAPQFSVSRGGTFVYIAGGLVARELVWISRTGETTAVSAPAQTYWSARVSPEGRRLALGVEAASYGVWMYDLARGTMERQSFEGTSAYPIWTPDGSRLTFNSTKSGGVLNLFWRPADSSGEDERLATSDNIQIANSWSPDGRVLAYQEANPQTAGDIWLFHLERRTTAPFLRSPFSEGGAAFSPNGRWIAYVSNEAGQPNVYVRPFPGPGEKVQVSDNGGGGAVWSRSGRELFYRVGDRFMAVAVTEGPRFQASGPRLLFETRLGLTRFPFQADYDVDVADQRFIIIRTRGAPAAVTRLEIVINGVASPRPRAE
jgi:serine/threonine-protein kinase